MASLTFLPRVGSTNTYLVKRAIDHPITPLHTVYTACQTAGRGQQGNGWESEPNMNLTFSTFFPPLAPLPMLNQLVPLAIVRALRPIVGSSHLCIKWPNDIYYGDEKLAGILIENITLGSHLIGSVAGVGLNVNQTHFVSPAPNPVSLKLITGEDLPLPVLLHAILHEFEFLWDALLGGQDDLIREEYMACLYRREGFHPYVEREVSTLPTTHATEESEQSFLAAIETIDPLGQLILRREDGSLHTYHFKQIRYIIPSNKSGRRSAV